MWTLHMYLALCTSIRIWIVLAWILAWQKEMVSWPPEKTHSTATAEPAICQKEDICQCDLVLLQVSSKVFIFWKNSVIMCSEHSVILSDPLTFGAHGFTQIFADFYKIYWARYCCQLTFYELTYKKWVDSNIRPNKFRKILKIFV